MVAAPLAPAASPASELDLFLQGAVAAYRARLSNAREAGERALIEGALTLLTDYRLCEIGPAGFEALLARMAAGRSPVRLSEVQPRAVAADVSERWRAYRSVTSRVRRG